MGFCLILGNELSEFMLTKKEILLEMNVQVHRAIGEGTQENCSATWLTVSGFVVGGFVSRSSLT